MTTNNDITAIGNITRDPELRFTTGGSAVATFGIACNRRYQKDGEWVEQVSYFNVTAWGSLGENVAASLSKGNRVIVTGRLEQRSWETDQGDKRSVVEIVADEIGPGLRWATVQIERTEREKVTREPASKPAAAPAKQSGGEKWGGDSYPYPDEEPF